MSDCVICGSSEKSAQGGLCPDHTYDEAAEWVTADGHPCVGDRCNICAALLAAHLPRPA